MGALRFAVTQNLATGDEPLALVTTISSPHMRQLLPEQLVILGPCRLIGQKCVMYVNGLKGPPPLAKDL